MGELPRRQAREGAAEAAGLAGPTILVVEGERSARELMQLHLSNVGYRVIAAEDAVVAVRRVLRDPPDLIVADVNMKYLDGLEFLAALREDGRARHVPVVFVMESDGRVERAMALGAQAYLTKPVLASRLLAVVGEQLARARLQRSELPPPRPRSS